MLFCSGWVSVFEDVAEPLPSGAESDTRESFWIASLNASLLPFSPSSKASAAHEKV